jgi:hypothetical protein
MPVSVTAFLIASSFRREQVSTRKPFEDTYFNLPVIPSRAHFPIVENNFTSMSTTFASQ